MFGDNPTRPDHPDFWRISQVLLDLDGAMQDASPEDQDAIFEALTNGVDLPSVSYAAMQRTMRILALSPHPSNYAKEMVAAAWFDGFITGQKFGEGR